MTVIVGIVERGKIYLGADSASSGESGVEILARPKLRKRSGLLVGACGDMRAINIILDGLVIPRYEGGPLGEWAVAVLHPAIYYAVPKKADWDVLVGIPQIDGGPQLMTVDSLGQCIVYHRSYAAIGSGSSHALGALALAGSGWRRRSARMRARKAMEIAAEHCNGVRGPFTVMSL